MPEEDKKAYARAVTAVERLLKIRLRSEYELRSRLADKNFDKEIIDAVVSQYALMGLVDDQLFAEQWIKSRQKKPYGARRIRYELIKKGVDKALIESKLRAGFEDFEEERTVLELARRRALKYKDTSDKQKIKQRLYAYLSRRGFSSSAIFNALKDYER